MIRMGFEVNWMGQERRVLVDEVRRKAFARRWKKERLLVVAFHAKPF